MAQPIGGPDRATLLAFAGVVLLGGLNAIAVKQTVAELDPFWGAGLRFILAGLLLTGLVLVTRRSFPRGRSLAGAVLYGLVGFAGAFGFAYPAFRDVPAGTGAVVIALAPLMTYALAVLQRQEAYRTQAVAGALIALLGVAIVFVDQLGVAVPLGSLALLLLGTLCLAESSVIVKWIPRSDPLATNAVAMLTAAAVLVSLSLIAGESPALPALTSTWLAVGYLVVLGSVVLFTLYLFGIARWTASAMSYTTLLLPFVSVTVATLFIGERFSLVFLVGGLVMLAGVYLGAFGRHRPHRSTATSMPECLPVEDCPEQPASLQPAAASGRG